MAKAYSMRMQLMKQSTLPTLAMKESGLDIVSRPEVTIEKIDKGMGTDG